MSMGGKRHPFEPVDLRHLGPFEEEWVALDDQRRVVEHSATLAELRSILPGNAGDITFFYVPSSKAGFAGSFHT